MADIVIKQGKYLQKKGSNIRYDLGYSSNDFTDELLSKLNGIAEGAQVNAIEKVQINGTDVAIGTGKVVNLTGLQAALTAGAGISIGDDNTIAVTLDTGLFVIVSSLPATPDEGNANKLHLVPSATSESGNIYTEYIYVTKDGASSWEKIGEYKAEVDLSGYVQKETDKGLSSNDFTDELLAKLNAIAESANKTTMSIDETNSVIYLDGIDEVAYTAPTTEGGTEGGSGETEGA